MNDLQRNALENSNIIDIWGDIDSSMAAYVRESILILNGADNPDILIRITSKGGQAIFGFAIYDDLRLYPGHKTCQIIGYAESAATIIVQACDTRQMTKHARFFIHEPITNDHFKINDLEDKSRLNDIIKNLKMAKQQMLDIYKNTANLSPEQLHDLLKREMSLNAEETLDCGFVDEII